MKIFLALVIGIGIGAAAIWMYSTDQGRTAVKSTTERIDSATRPARDAIAEKVDAWHLTPQELREELAKTGKVARQKAQDAGKAINDATLDARITGAIKGKLIADRQMSALAISVNTTDGVVTLAGAVNSPEEISRAMLIAMDNEGVREVVSTLQVRGSKRP